ncbi:MAG: 1-acyl-sn-glycerol-3-phosphate acyltransferase [Gammaproteobacteria bacterium]|nr:1-acyl-sn-glycerol-3-phosphate acyltransferase [Gammaproteobacteria bacterium]
MFRTFRIITRLALICAHLLTGYLLALIFLTKPMRNLGFYQPKVLIQRWLFLLGYFIGCRVTSEKEELETPTLLLSNHVSWLDILVLGGIYPVQFLSKEEVAKWPIIGFLTTISGTLLIKRGSGSTGAIHEISQSLEHGNSVCIFPEATTSSGITTKPFHSRLLKAAYDNHHKISTVSLSYSSDDVNRDANLGWEKQTFLEHAFYILGQTRTYAKAHLVHQHHEYNHRPRKEIANECRQAIEEDLKQNHYPCE